MVAAVLYCTRDTAVFASWQEVVLLYCTVGCKSVPTFLGFNSDFSDSFGTFCPFGRGLKPGPENDPTQNWAQNQRGTTRGAPRTGSSKKGRFVIKVEKGPRRINWRGPFSIFIKLQ